MDATQSLSIVGAMKPSKPAMKIASASSELLSISSSNLFKESRTEKGGFDNIIQCSWGRE
jgi:hypothetical protein